MLIKGSLFLTFALAAVTAVPATPIAYAADRDCSDFSNQAAAQQFFLNNGGPSQDPHRLDDDGDGLACESNGPPYQGLLTIRYADPANAFRGKIKPVTSACESARTVKVFKQRDGRDRLIGSDTTSAEGRYSVVKHDPRGRFYAKSVARGQCHSERSRTIRVE